MELKDSEPDSSATYAGPSCCIVEHTSDVHCSVTSPKGFIKCLLLRKECCTYHVRPQFESVKWVLADLIKYGYVISELSIDVCIHHLGRCDCVCTTETPIIDVWESSTCCSGNSNKEALVVIKPRIDNISLVSECSKTNTVYSDSQCRLKGLYCRVVLKVGYNKHKMSLMLSRCIEEILPSDHSLGVYSAQIQTAIPVDIVMPTKHRVFGDRHLLSCICVGRSITTFSRYMDHVIYQSKGYSECTGVIHDISPLCCIDWGSNDFTPEYALVVARLASAITGAYFMGKTIITQGLYDPSGMSYICECVKDLYEASRILAMDKKMLERCTCCGRIEVCKNYKYKGRDSLHSVRMCDGCLTYCVHNGDLLDGSGLPRGCCIRNLIFFGTHSC